jgi:hypothetical protein
MRKLIVAAVILLGSALLAIHCFNGVPERSFTTTDLLIDSSVFPVGWQVSAAAASPTERLGQIGGSQIEFRASVPILVGAIQSVFRFRSSASAASRFDRMQASWFNSNSVFSITPWELPSQLPYYSAVADKSRFACHDTEVGGRATVCQFIGQYDEYIVVFHTVMTPEDMQPQSYMTFANLECILEAIDERMRFYLSTGTD